MPETIPVRIRDCACPHTPHADEGDLVYIRPKLSLRGGIAAQQDILASRLPDGSLDEQELVARWMVTYVTHGATGWNLLDEDGRPVPFSTDALLDDADLGMPVANAADEQYAEAVLRPLGLSRSTT